MAAPFESEEPVMIRHPSEEEYVYSANENS